MNAGINFINMALLYGMGFRLSLYIMVESVAEAETLKRVVGM